MIQKSCHWALKTLSQRKHQQFIKSLSDPEQAQRTVLDKILKKYQILYPNIANLTEFKNSFGPSIYDDWKAQILKQKSSGI